MYVSGIFGSCFAKTFLRLISHTRFWGVLSFVAYVKTGDDRFRQRGRRFCFCLSDGDGEPFAPLSAHVATAGGADAAFETTVASEAAVGGNICANRSSSRVVQRCGGQGGCYSCR